MNEVEPSPTNDPALNVRSSAGDSKPASVSNEKSGHGQKSEVVASAGIITDGDRNDIDEDDVVVLVFDEEQVGVSAATDPNSSVEDETAVENADEKKEFHTEQVHQETFEEADNVSQLSSLPSTPISYAENLANFAAMRRARGRKRRTAIALNVGKKFGFLRAVTNQIGKRCLRRLMDRDNGDSDSLPDDNSCFLPRNDHGMTTINDAKAIPVSKEGNDKFQSDYFRALFFSQYDDPSAPVTVDEPAITCDVDVDDSGPAKEATNDSCAFPEENDVDQALSKNLEISLSTFKGTFDEAQDLAASVGEALGREDDDCETMWKDAILKLAETSSQKKLTERVAKLLNDVHCSNLIAAGNPDEWALRSQSIKRAASLLRQHFASGLTTSGLSLLSWMHWLLLKNLPYEIGAWYLLVLRELYQKTPEIVFSVISFDQDVSQRAIDLLSGFVLDQKRLVMSNEMFLHHHPPPRLPRDPILMLVSSTLKAHSDMLGRGSLRCQQFYKNLFPHLGFCMDLKFAPFKRGMSIGLCADQLCASVRDKIREVRYFHANRPIILVGWQTSSLVALKIALEKSVAAVVCLGFPNVTLSGPRGGPEDELLNVTCPTLFVVGQFAATCSMEDLAELKRDMKSEKTGLIVVGGADDELKMSETKLSSENLCQEIVDRCILESVGEFLSSVLESYVEPTVDVSVVATVPGPAKPECVATLAPLGKRKRIPIQSSPSAVLDLRKMGAVRVKVKGKSKANTSTETPAEEKRPRIRTISLSPEGPTKGGKEESAPMSPIEDSQMPTFSATRTRQIKKPTFLDL